LSISREDVEHVARLAHLELAPGEIDGLARDLAAILEYAACLDTVDTGDIDPAGDGGEETSRLRDDAVAPGLRPGRATEGAPDAENGLFKVPPAFTGE
jgi:aspartyl-tRNA(Asn)/glutamyl-tRNA(Gln) amidotransferase subunit C